MQALGGGSAFEHWLDPVVVGAEGARDPLGWKSVWNSVGELLLLRRDQRLLDLLGGVGERRGRGRGDLLDLDHVAAVVALERADELALGGAERSASSSAGSDWPATTPWRRPPCPWSPRRSSTSSRPSSRSWRRGRCRARSSACVGLLLGLGEDDADVTRLGLLELGVVLLVVALDLVLGRSTASCGMTFDCSSSLRRSGSGPGP